MTGTPASGPSEDLLTGATTDAPGAAVAGAFPTPPQQQEMPLAVVRGQPVLQMPQDLYIPPDAL
jgi:segregation and condensation protein A